MNSAHIQSNKQPEDENDWLLTFADLMMLLLAFFVLLFSLSSIDARKYAELSKFINESFSSDMANRENKQKYQLTKPEQRKQAILQKLSNMSGEVRAAINDKNIEIITTDSHLIFRLRDQFAFESGSAVLRPESEQALTRISATIARTEGKIEVSGHTDNIPIETEHFSSNWLLSAARAAEVSEYLTNAQPGIEERIVVKAHSSNLPLADNSTSAGRAINRRVEISLSFE
ncbi:OmpA/MotB family protein [Methylophaga sp.]|uniref:OmpA/MotB family protein n=1 Tax=Methylophaga sp. TaxID=2024840 RepID=UPI003F69B34A